MRRLRFALLATLPALALVSLHAYTGCYPGCVIWTDSNPELYVFLCYLC